MERIPTGISGLDDLIEGGLPKGKSYLITGEPGTGKSIFCLQFLHTGLERGEKGILVAIDEKPSDVIEQAASLGWDLEKYIEKKDLLVLDASAYFSSREALGREKQLDIRKAMSDLCAYVKRLGAQRLVLDPAGPFVLTRDSLSRIQDQARSLVQILRNTVETTNLLTSYAVPRTGERGMHGAEEYLVAGAIVLEMVLIDNRLARTLIIEKMRSTAVEPMQHEFKIIKGQGIVLQPLP